MCEFLGEKRRQLTRGLTATVNLTKYNINDVMGGDHYYTKKIRINSKVKTRDEKIRRSTHRSRDNSSNW